VKYALHADDRPDGRLFEVGVFTQRLLDLAGPRHDEERDEVLYVLSGTGFARFAGDEHELRPGVALFVPAGTEWSADGDARAVSVLVHDPEPRYQVPGAGTWYLPAVVDCEAVEKGTATAGRQFVLGAACPSATQFIGLIPPGRAPDHFHRYDEVIYVLEGEGVLHGGGEDRPVTAGSCIHLPPFFVHSLENSGDTPMRIVATFHPSGDPASRAYEANE
jgi:quercetin dioxygenase-like cupin family protein